MIENRPKQKNRLDEQPRPDMQDEKTRELLLHNQQLSLELEGAANDNEKIKRSKLIESVQRIGRGGKKIARGLAWSALASVAIGAPTLKHKHESSRYEVTTEVIGGENIHQHQDYRTTNILNYLSGHAALPESERIHVYRELVRQTAIKQNLQLPDSFDDLTQEELADLYASFYIEAYAEEGLNEEETEEARQRAIITLLETGRAPVGDHEANEELYENIWALERRVGAPLIRWASESEDGLARFMSLASGEGRQFYDPVQNTIYINPIAPFDSMVAEGAHAVQFNEDPVGSYTSLVSGLGRTAVRIIQGESPRDAQDAEYSVEGSLEHEAHEEIEAQLESYLPEEEE